MSTLTRNAIWEEITKLEDRLVITPLLDEAQVGPSSVDVRLGQQFIVLKRAAITHIDPTDKTTLDQEIQRSQQKIRVPLNEPFTIHPGQLVLASTLEYFSMPNRIAASVEGRSSWGRLGLIVATACNVDPGFKGCITLELVNDGEAPLALYPGVRIAQLVFHTTVDVSNYFKSPSENETSQNAKYDCPIGPQFSRIRRDKEMSFWGPRCQLNQ